MKKRLLSLVLCLVMVFSLFPLFDLSAGAVVVDDVYESIDGVTNWTPNSDYAGYAAQSDDGKLYYRDEDNVFHPVDYSTTDTLWHADTRTNWTAATAATAGAATNATNSALYYQKVDNLNSKVVVSKTNYFTKQSANNVDCTTNAVEKPSFVNYRQTDLYVYVPHDASSADNGEGCWHRVYYAECGADGLFQSPLGGTYGYFYTFFYFTNVQEGSTNAAESNGFYNSNNRNANRGDTFGSGDTQITLLSKIEECGVWTYAIGYATKRGYEGKWTNSTANGTDGNLYKKSSGNSSSYNKITTGAGATIVCPIPNGNSSSTSHTYSGTFYTRVPLKVSVLKEADTNMPFSQAVSEDTDTLYAGTLYIKLPDEVTDPNPGEGGEGGILNPGGVDDAGFKLQKSLSQNNEGTYDITMQSYSTANTIQESRLEKVPTDFVVIVDQSGSMADRDMATGYREISGTKTLEQCATGSYYYKDGDNYYRVYGKKDYLMEFHATETKWTQNIINDAGYDLSWFQGTDEAEFSQSNQYYYKTTDGVYRPVHVTARGVLGTYYIKFYYQNAGGQPVDFIRPVRPIYKNVFGSDTSKYGPGSFMYGAVDAAVQAAYSDTKAYTYSEFLGITTGMYVNYPMYTRHVGYSQLAYRDVNGIEHIVKTTAGGTTAEYCDSSANALTAATDGTRMNYSGLYEATGYKTRLEALKGALTDFVRAVAAESDTKQGEDTVCAVDNRIAIVGFSSPGYRTTEIITGNNVRMSSATTADYKAALINATDGQVGADHVNPALTTAINSLEAYGGTQPELGFQMAKSIFDNRQKTTYDLVTAEGVTKNRNKIVIFFTDGQPGDNEVANQYTEANDVVANALPLKNAGVKVFSIGVFGESDGNPLTYSDRTASSESATKDWKFLGGWMETYRSGGTYYCLRRQWRPAGADAADNYTAVANDTIFDYMSVTSSNYPDAENFIAPTWLTGRYNGANGYTGATDGVRHKETASTVNRFYRMASNQETLVAAFEQSVSYASTLQQTTGAVMLDTTTVFRDVINTADFDISNATYSVTWQPIYVNKSLIATTGSAIGNLENDPDYPVVTPVVNQPVPETGVIEYQGFNYGANYVSWGHVKGYKLIVTVHGIVPTTYNQTIASNVDPDPEHQIYGCGIYEAGHDEPTYSVKSPTLLVELHEPANGDVVMTKGISAPDQNDGSYTITLDAYAEGNFDDEEVKLDGEGYLMDVINLNNLTVRSDLSEAEVHVYTQKGTYNENSSNANHIDWDPTPVEITDQVEVSFVSVGTNRAVKVTGFDYAANFIGAPKLPNSREGTAANQGKKLIVTIGGLVPKHPGSGQTSNISAGVYNEQDDLVASAESPTFDISYNNNNAKTYVVDFAAPMTIATSAKSVAKMSGDNGDFSLFDEEVVYQITKSVDSGNLALSGVDQAFAYAIPVDSDLQSRAWSVLTTVPASSVYFGDFADLTEPLEVGDGHGYAQIVASEGSDINPPTQEKVLDEEGNPTYDEQGNLITETVPAPSKQFTFSFNGTGIDVYCTTVDDGGYIMARVDGDYSTVKTIKNQAQNERYNTPTISYRNLGPGAHTLVLYVLQDANYKLEGIRVYNPIAEGQYTGDIANEANAKYTNLRSLLVNDDASEFTYAEGSRTGGLLFLDDATKVAMEQAMTDTEGNPLIDDKTGEPVMQRVYATDYLGYKANSPKNEIYLAQNQGIAFTVTGYSKLNDTAKNNIYVGLSTPKNQTANVKFSSDVNAAATPISSAVDMYYKITPANVDGDAATFVIINTSNVTVSLTNLKISGNNAPVNVVAGGGAIVMSANEAEPVTLELVINETTLKVLAGLTEETVTPPDDPTPTPGIAEWIHQLISSFVSNLFKSISRLFGN